MDEVALYRHPNFLRSLEGHNTSWEEYVEAICYRFGGIQDPLEELRQHGDLEEYIQDFDILWNKAEINEKQALVIFLGHMELEIKNIVKIFEPKTLKHTFNFSKLQANTLSYQKSPRYVRKPSTLCTNPIAITPLTFPQQTSRNPGNSHTNSYKPHSAQWTPNPTNNIYPNPSKPTKFIKNQEFEDRRLKGLCFPQYSGRGRGLPRRGGGSRESLQPIGHTSHFLGCVGRNGGSQYNESQWKNGQNYSVHLDSFGQHL